MPGQEVRIRKHLQAKVRPNTKSRLPGPLQPVGLPQTHAPPFAPPSEGPVRGGASTRANQGPGSAASWDSGTLELGGCGEVGTAGSAGVSACECAARLACSRSGGCWLLRPHLVSARSSWAPALGVLAAWDVTFRAAAWLLLGVAAGLASTLATTPTPTRTPTQTPTPTPTDAGTNATCPEIILRQEVLKDGFHRDLLIKVKFGESIENFQACRLLLRQLIPAGLLVDPYELASLEEKNLTESVITSEDNNIEAPSYLSKELEVLMYARQDPKCVDCFQAFIPVHYRYHRPHSGDGETFVVINNPDLLMHCDQEFPILKCWSQSQVAAPCTLKSKDICLWNNMKYKSVSSNVTLQVPVGLTVHTSLVCAGTLLVTFLCSTLILVAVFKYGDFSSL
ncbi:phosphatidylinositol-glycan biosynthesis class X protein [Sorex fumeus]|uniref:phosphatidylinositol-glycan biosynthesis class X protein n=1 Tax=Sorex fumeus TaxID=62283 RepID=UPI0024ADD2B1|nr:phosphatidylinositol-glycan biosynthesis class X protein [Sorex fumeus]